MTIRALSIFAVAVAIAVVTTHETSASGQKRPPNVVLIMTDDQGWGDIQSHGNTTLHTPVLDRLARQGARLERFYVCAVCAPTRASLLTGRYHLRTGVHGVTRGYETMRAREITIAEVLKQAGYATGIFGKWHNGAHFPYHPNGQGFDEFVGFCAGHWNNYFGTTLEHNGRPLGTKGYITDVLTNHALRFITQNQKRPFFCYLAYNAPHSPFQVPDTYYDKYKAKGLDNMTACVYGMVENIDDNVGRILRALERLQLADNTIVIFLTDNGPNSNRFNGGMRGRKGSVHEGGVRVPCFIRWPAHIRAGTTIPHIAAHIDLMPTVLDLARVPSPKKVDFDGMSLARLLRGKGNGWPERMIFSHRARAGKVNMYPGAVRSQRYRAVNHGKRWELYDMAKDPSQKTNIAKDHPAVVAKLGNAYRTWYTAVTRAGFAPIPIPLGLRQRPSVDLPAHESFLKGTVRYKGKAGWANDWITNWRSKQDVITWPVDVKEKGTYLVTLMYVCPKQDLGATVRLQIAGKTMDAVVRHAHDPAPVFSPDRVARGEVYEKVWDRLMVGNVLLRAGRTQLQLRAVGIPRGQVMELKAVRVQRVD